MLSHLGERSWRSVEPSLHRPRALLDQHCRLLEIRRLCKRPEAQQCTVSARAAAAACTASRQTRPVSALDPHNTLHSLNTVSTGRVTTCFINNRKGLVSLQGRTPGEEDACIIPASCTISMEVSHHTARGAAGVHMRADTALPPAPLELGKETLCAQALLNVPAFANKRNHPQRYRASPIDCCQLRQKIVYLCIFVLPKRCLPEIDVYK